MTLPHYILDLLVLATMGINNLVWYRRWLKAQETIAELREQLGKVKRSSQSGEHHTPRSGATPDVRKIDDSGERVHPGRTIDPTGSLSKKGRGA